MSRTIRSALISATSCMLTCDGVLVRLNVAAHCGSKREATAGSQTMHLFVLNYACGRGFYQLSSCQRQLACNVVYVDGQRRHLRSCSTAVALSGSEIVHFNLGGMCGCEARGSVGIILRRAAVGDVHPQNNRGMPIAAVA